MVRLNSSTLWRSLYVSVLRKFTRGYLRLNCFPPPPLFLIFLGRKNNWPPLPEKFPVGPCFYHDISVDIPVEFQKTVKIMYYLWMCECLPSDHEILIGNSFTRVSQSAAHWVELFRGMLVLVIPRKIISDIVVTTGNCTAADLGWGGTPSDVFDLFRRACAYRILRSADEWNTVRSSEVVASRFGMSRVLACYSAHHSSIAWLFELMQPSWASLVILLWSVSWTRHSCLQNWMFSSHSQILMFWCEHQPNRSTRICMILSVAPLPCDWPIGCTNA